MNFSSPSTRRIASIAIPMILAGISTPLLGMVDTAVIGHLPHAHYLGAIAVGSMIFNLLFWSFGFLRMSATGLAAQNMDYRPDASFAVLAKGILLALFISVLILLLRDVLGAIIFPLIDSSTEVVVFAQAYFHIRVWAMPATLVRYVILGWMLGMQYPRGNLSLLLLLNSINIVLDLFFVIVLQWEVAGVAWATVVAEYVTIIAAWMILQKQFPGINRQLRQQLSWRWRDYTEFFAINSNIFLRTMGIIFVFAFFTWQGARFGDVVLAANAVLLNFQIFMAYAMDGIAHAAEALSGRYYHQRTARRFRLFVQRTGFISLLVAAAFSLFYALFGGYLIGLLTDIPEVLDMAKQYQWWVVVLPLISYAAFWYDGVFIGTSRSREMRDAMLVSLLVFALSWSLTSSWGNEGLWFSFLVFMGVRGLSLHWIYRRHGHRWLARQ